MTIHHIAQCTTQRLNIETGIPTYEKYIGLGVASLNDIQKATIQCVVPTSNGSMLECTLEDSKILCFMPVDVSSHVLTLKTSKLYKCAVFCQKQGLYYKML